MFNLTVIIALERRAGTSVLSYSTYAGMYPGICQLSFPSTFSTSVLAEVTVSKHKY